MELSVKLRELRESHHAPGLGAAVRLDGKLLWSSWEGEPPLSGRLRSPIYSVTKSFTAAIVYSLASGMPLTARIADLLPELGLPSRITISHLLQHTSGLCDYGWLERYQTGVRDFPSQPWSEERFLQEIGDGGTLFEAGEGWAYSNLGFMLLRLAVEKVTSLSYRECVKRFITTPLGLEDTFVAEGVEDWVTCIPGYGSEISRDGLIEDVRASYHPGWCAPGVAVSSPEDVTLFYDALFAGDLLEASALQDMCELIPVPGVHAPAVSPACGRGVLADSAFPGGPSFGHGGGGPGYAISASILPFLPQGRLSIALVCNGSGCRADLMERKLLSHVQSSLNKT